ncbi:unnamed protein product [Protopolystoma xenopodis]|uniref:Uncharacterized protein n=1 Tax=Protopolystoma xenopodis TaxID=117903 RepID=A0A448XF95_9PLAT|nr:unnamed protein product [Protopolystoma xenopodis]
MQVHAGDDRTRVSGTLAASGSRPVETAARAETGLLEYETSLASSHPFVLFVSYSHNRRVREQVVKRKIFILRMPYRLCHSHTLGASETASLAHLCPGECIKSCQDSTFVLLRLDLNLPNGPVCPSITTAVSSAT